MALKSKDTGADGERGAWGKVESTSTYCVDFNYMIGHFEKELAKIPEEKRKLAYIDISCSNYNAQINIGTKNPEETQNDDVLRKFVEKVTEDISKIANREPLSQSLRKGCDESSCGERDTY